MHHSRHNKSGLAGPLRHAAAQAERWTRQIDQMKDSLPASVVLDDGPGQLNDRARSGPAAFVGSAPRTVVSGPKESVRGADPTQIARGQLVELTESAMPGVDLGGTVEPPNRGPSGPPAVVAPAAQTLVDAAGSFGSVVARDLSVDPRHANPWTQQVESLKASQPARTAADSENDSTFEAIGPLQSVHSTRGASDWSMGFASGRQSSASPWKTLEEGTNSGTDSIVAVDRSSTGEAGGDDNTGGHGGASDNTQESATLLTQTNQQLELIRQTLEKILAKPGSVVLD